jgi:hypothetical protein
MRTRRRWATAAVVALLPLLASCSDRITTDTEMVWDQGTPSPGDGQPVDTTFTLVQRQVLGPSCALSGCHADAEYPNLSADRAWANLVGVASSVPGLSLVTPGDPDRSYLYLKITGGPGMEGSLMPRNRGALSAADKAVVRAWIARGAPND